MSASEDYALFRKYEPVLVFSPDERFFPMPVEDFIRHSRLWSVPLKLGSLPLVRRRWKGFDPQNDFAGALRRMASERARNGFVYLEYVDWRALFPLFGRAWPLVGIELGLTLLPPAILAGALRWPPLLAGLLPGVALGLVAGGTALALGRRLLRGEDAFAQLPRARLRSFQTLVLLEAMLSAIVGALVAGPVVALRSGQAVKGGLLWLFGWLLAAVLAHYIMVFFRGGVLQLSSLFAIISGLNDGTSDAAHRKTRARPAGQPPGSEERTFPYYARIWPPDPAERAAHQYVALQYWFFYPFNDWRTRYNGIDDHEGDWEHVTLILSRSKYGGPLHPTYLVYSQHILPGAFLRRAWDDPAVVKVRHGEGWHPVAYVAAGSHAHYYRRGRHGMDELLRFSKPASRLYASLLHNRLRGRVGPGMERPGIDLRATPVSLGALGEYLIVWPKRGLPQVERLDLEELVDYAAVSPADPFSEESGPSIGPGQVAGWECVLIQDDWPIWMRYNGNWGKYVAYMGESAPRGPRFASKLDSRAEWANPITAAGLLPVMLKPEQQSQ